MLRNCWGGGVSLKDTQRLIVSRQTGVGLHLAGIGGKKDLFAVKHGITGRFAIACASWSRGLGHGVTC